MSKSPVAGIFLLLAEKSDGKKTLAGILLTIGGLLTYLFTPEYKEEGIAMIASGIPILITGISHKFVKAKQQEAE